MRRSIAVWTAVFGLACVAGVAAEGRAAPATPAPQGDNVPQEVGGDKDWTGYSYAERGAKVCYLIGQPEKSEPAHATRGRIDAMVTERPREHQLNVVTFDVGVALKDGSEADLAIDGHSFSLFTNKDSAWARDAATDKAVTEELARGRHAVLKGISTRGVALTQSYSLAGFKEALAAIDKACNIRR